MNERLDSWKQIASYFGRDVRTVQRWERLEGLPVHRHVHQRGGSVWADVAQLEQWRAQRQLARDIPAQPEGKVSPGWTEYLKGRVWWNRAGEAAVRNSLRHYQSALRLDGNLVQAWEALGESWCALGYYDRQPPRPSFEQAQQCAARALQLNPQSGPAHAVLGNIAWMAERLPQKAEQLLRSALQLAPKHISTHYWLAIFLAARGESDSAKQILKDALQIDPVALAGQLCEVTIAYLSDELPVAEAASRALLELHPELAAAHLLLGLVLEAQDRLPEALASFRQAWEQGERSPACVAAIGNLRRRTGDTKAAAEAISALHAMRAQGAYVSEHEFAVLALAKGTETAAREAINCLRRAYEDGSAWMVFLPCSPRFRSLRHRRDFQKLCDLINKGRED